VPGRPAELGACRGLELMPSERIVSLWSRSPWSMRARWWSRWHLKTCTGSRAGSLRRSRSSTSGRAVGFVQATLTREGADLVADISWLVTPSEQGRGLAGEAASAAVSWLTSMGVGRLQAYVHPDHTASARIADRLGLVPTSTLIDGEILWEAALR
jgi:RimJ/RimL family protein N-acetyltransferase